MRRELFINNVSIPLSDDIVISVTKSIKDVQEPDKVKSDYTKTISLPSSKPLNKLLTYIFEINAEGDFNVNKKADALYLEDGLTVISGYYQLKDISVTDDNDIVYEGAIFGETANFFTELGTKELTDIQDLDDFNHDYTAQNQIDSWATKIQFKGVDQTFSLGSGYVYPLINYGFDNTLNDYPTTSLFPAFYKKELFDRVVKDAGYTYEGANFKNNIRFKRSIIPFTGLSFGLTDSQIQQRVFKSDTPLLVGNSDPLVTSTEYLPVRFTNEIQDLGGVYNSANGQYTVSNKGRYSLVTSLRLNMEFTPIGNIVPVKSNCYYEVRLNYRKNGTLFANSLLNVHPDFSQDIAVGTTYTTEASATYPSNEYSSSINTMGVVVSKLATTPNEMRTVVNDVFFNVGDVITVELICTLKNRLTVNGSGSAYMFQDSSGNYYSGIASIFALAGSFENKVVNTEVMEDDEIDMNQCVPKNIKQRDFVTSIFNEFNIYAQPSRDNPKHLILLPRDDFYNSEVVDWSSKLDKSQELVISPMGLLDYSKYTYTYKKDKDYYNELYSNAYNRTYGDRIINVDNDFIKDEKVTELIFASTPIVGQSYNDLVVPSILKVDANGNANRTEGIIRSLVYGGLIKTDTAWTHNNAVRTTYPFAGMVDNPFNPTFDSKFDFTREIYYSPIYRDINLTDNNLYNAFHKKGLEEITDKNSKIFTGWFNLNSLDIALLDFRKQYFFNNSYFRLQKIYNYNSSMGELTKCEFLKIKIKDNFIPLIGTVIGGVQVPIGASFLPVIDLSQSKMKGNNSYNTITQNVIGNNNLILRSATNVNVVGNNNTVNDFANNINIEGNNNFIDSGLENITIINSNNLTVTESNKSYINGLDVSKSEYLQYYTNSNTLVTTINTIGFYEDVNCLTTQVHISENFTEINNYVEYGSTSALFKITVTASLNSSNNNELGLAVFVNGLIVQCSEAISTSNSGGRVEGIVSQCLINLEVDDNVIVKVANHTSTNDITAENMNVIITKVI